MIYLDNAATTFPSKEALDAFITEATLGANPSSMHRAGFDAHTRLEGYRAVIAKTLSASPDEIIFTSGGTECANIALFGAARALKRRGNKILVSDAEHPCVSESVRALEGEGFTVVKISTRDGKLDLAAIEQAADENTVLAAFMHANNETGALFDVAAAGAIVKRKSRIALTYVDAVQSYGKVPVHPKALGADLVGISAHKIHGVRGCGALYVRHGVRLVTPVIGGGQEQGRRSGTENAPAIAAFATAARILHENADAYRSTLKDLAGHLREQLSALPGVTVLTPAHRVEHIVSAAFSGYKSEVLLHLFSDAGLYVSSGSACSSKKGAKSPVLLAHGLSADAADSTLRFSLSVHTTKDDIDRAIAIAREILEKGRFVK